MRLLIILGTILLYLSDVTIWFLDCDGMPTELYDGLSIAEFVAFLAGLLCLFIAAAISFFRVKKERHEDYRFIFVMKLVLLPHMIYIFAMSIVCLVCGLIVLPTIFFMASLAVWLFSWLMLLHSYLCVVCLAVPSVISLYRGYQEHGLSIGFLAGISLFFPVINIVGSAYLFLHSCSPE